MILPVTLFTHTVARTMFFLPVSRHAGLVTYLFKASLSAIHCLPQVKSVTVSHQGGEKGTEDSLHHAPFHNHSLVMLWTLQWSRIYIRVAVGG